MKGAVIAKPSFRGFDSNCKDIRQLLSGFETLYTFTELGGAYFDSEFNNSRNGGKLKSAGYVPRFYEIAEILCKEQVDVLVTVGGDGIASYGAGAIIACGNRGLKTPGIIGFPAGTANVGPIVQKNVGPHSLECSKRLDAIEVSSGGKVLGYGFNDVILGTSLLGTVNGLWANVDAKVLAMQGIVSVCQPKELIAGESFALRLNRENIDVSSWNGRLAQVCVSTLHQDNFNGRAVTGGLGESIGFEHPAAVALLDKVSVDAREETWNCKILRDTGHLCFCDTDEISISGLEKDVCAIIDGNPFVIDNGEVTVRCKANAVSVFGYGR